MTAARYYLSLDSATYFCWYKDSSTWYVHPKILHLILWYKKFLLLDAVEPKILILNTGTVDATILLPVPETVDLKILLPNTIYTTSLLSDSVDPTILLPDNANKILLSHTIEPKILLHNNVDKILLSHPIDTKILLPHIIDPKIP
jgi:hypothetical protein